MIWRTSDSTRGGADVELDESAEDPENIYTTKTDIPQYQITGEEPAINELWNGEKAAELIEEIRASNVTDEQKDFLIAAAYRHFVFNYKKIAEYYAHQDKTMQELMEKSALVIIDFEDAIKNGYVQLSDVLDRLLDEDKGDDDAA